MKTTKRFCVTNEFYTKDLGLLFYFPNRGNYEPGKKSKGFGSIKYPEGSVYTGDLYFDGKNFHKLGFGRQDFSSVKNHLFVKYQNFEAKYMSYIGQFDYKKTDWIYGNGIMYYRDKSGNPVGFMKGFFEGLCKTKEWEGPFDWSILEDGFTKEMEFNDYIIFYDYLKPTFDKYFSELVNPNEDYDLMLLGDSYFDFLRDDNYTKHSYHNELTKQMKVLNLAVGGSTFGDWLEYLSTNQFVLNKDPKIIVTNLGFNDIHGYQTYEHVVKNFETYLSIIRKMFPTSKLLFTTVCQAPGFGKTLETEIKYNKMLLSQKQKYNIEIIDFSKLLKSCKGEVFNQDNVHPGKDGYTCYFKELRKLKNN